MVRESQNSFFKTDTYHVYLQNEKKHVKDIDPERANKCSFFQASYSNVLRRDHWSGDPSCKLRRRDRKATDTRPSPPPRPAPAALGERTAGPTLSGPHGLLCRLRICASQRTRRVSTQKTHRAESRPSTSVPTARRPAPPTRAERSPAPRTLGAEARAPGLPATRASGRGQPLSPAALKPPLPPSAAAKTRAQMSKAGRPGMGPGLRLPRCPRRLTRGRHRAQLQPA